ncbi:GNAT family N-acetyltransferase [Aquimarina agarilytica]|uniref:GNAT family N-acetyltransferase n=1 Tax=Aquimarina agarilytica TaxID=1087449 RepID=UPI000287B52B|nr:GNAT family N-acetyltransferase [Aquimarina agarilytica]
MIQQTHITPILAEETIPVRQPMLRAGLPVSSCIFKGDELSSTLHLGAFHNNQLVGVVTYMQQHHKLFKQKNQYQLRGMAVLTNFQGNGIGELLVKKGQDLLKEQSIDLIWCNARKVAVAFYEKNAFFITGDPFDIPGVGTHYLMSKKI